MNTRPHRTAPARKTSLAQLGGPTDVDGTHDDEKAALRHAFDVGATETAALPHVHAFHSYPARMHPDTAARLVEALSEPGDTVLDPFCGSATVLVEARRLGRRALGCDVNPLSAELAWLKTLAPAEEFLVQLEAEAARVAAHAEERRSRRAGATQRLGERDRTLFAPHVALELDGLRDGILATADEPLRRALLLVLSAMLPKFMQRAEEATPGATPRRVAPGFATRFMVKKTAELVGQLRTYRALVPADAPAASFRVADARRLDGVPPSSVRLIITSPPYPGVYDYLDHHEDRLRWLGLSSTVFNQLEIGSRRELSRESTFGAALGRWERDLGAALEAMARVLKPGGRAVLLIADSTLAGRPVFADRVVGSLAEKVGLDFRARASQERPHFHAASKRAFRSSPRCEHLLLLARD